MNKDFFKNLQQIATNIKLTRPEKKHFRLELLKFMDAHDVKNDKKASISFEKTNPFTWLHSLTQNVLRFKSAAFIVVVVVLLSSGAALAAQNSLPGDFLYPVKISFIEKIEGSFAVSLQAKAEFEQNLVERRLREAEELATNNRLNAQIKNGIAMNLEEHSTAFHKNINQLKQENQLQSAIDTTSNFTISLKVHSKILAALEEKTVNETRPEEQKKENENTLLSTYLDTKIENLIKVEDKVNEQITAQTLTVVEASALAKMKVAAKKITEVKKLVSNIKTDVSTDIKAKAEDQLKLAQESFDEGGKNLESRSYGRAFILFQEAETQAQGVKLILQASENLKIQIDAASLLNSSTMQNTTIIKNNFREIIESNVTGEIEGSSSQTEPSTTQTLNPEIFNTINQIKMPQEVDTTVEVNTEESIQN